MKNLTFISSLLCCLSIICFSASFADETKKNLPFKIIKVKSDKASEVNIIGITSGILKKKAKGKRYIMSYTSAGKPIWAQKWHRSPPQEATDIPVISGYHFGFYVTLANLPRGEKVVVEMVDTLPKEIIVDGIKAKQLKQVYRLPKNGRKFHLVTTFNKKEAQLMQVGKWKKELFCNGKLIHSKVFNLVKPSAEEALQNKEYEEYMDKVAGKAVQKK